MGGVLSRLTSGLWIHNFGYIAPTWLILACHIASALSVIFLVPENHERATNERHKFFNLKNLKTLLNVFKKKRESGSRKTLLLLVFTGAVITLTTQGLGGVTALFVMRSPLCFSPKLVGYFLAYRMFISGVGGAIGVKLLRKCFNEMVTSGISIVCQIAEMVLLAFATRTWLIFVGKWCCTTFPVIMKACCQSSKREKVLTWYKRYIIISLPFKLSASVHWHLSKDPQRHKVCTLNCLVRLFKKLDPAPDPV